MTTVTEVQQHNAQSRERVLNKTLMSDRAFAERNDVDHFGTSLAIQAAMMELAAIWREEAAAFVEAKRRGWKSTADGRTQAAALLAGFAVGLVPPTGRNVVSTGTLVIPIPDEPGLGDTCPWCGKPAAMDAEACPACTEGLESGRWMTADGTRYPSQERLDDVSHAAYPMFGCQRHERCAALPDPFPKSMTVGEAEDAVIDGVRLSADAIDAMREACSHPDAQRSTLKSGVIMCTLCSQAVGQVEHLPAIVPGSRPGPVITGDPTMDYLTGAVDRYEPFGYVPHRLEVPAEMTATGTPVAVAELTPAAASFYRISEHARMQAPCFECLSVGEDPAPWCDCISQEGQPCKGPCRLLAHAYTFHPQGCSHRARTTNPDPTKCMYCGTDISVQNFHGITAKDLDPPVTIVNAEPGDDTHFAWTPPADPTQRFEVIASTTPNPFTSPAAPSRNRPAVKRLTYADLGSLTATTYPYPRAHLSHSYVESLSKCGLSALLSDASRAGHIAPRRPSWSLIGGNAFHVAIEGIERASIAIGGAAPTAELGAWEEFWEEALKFQIEETTATLIGSPYADPSTWHIANKGLEGYDWWRVQGLDMVQRYLAHHDTAWRSTHTLLQVPVERVLTPVLELPFAVSAGSTAITMEGRIDAAWLATGPEYPTATLEVVDHKAGKSLPVDHFQLVEYGDVLRKHLPPNFALSVVGRYWRARLGTYTPPVPLPAAPGQAEIDYRYSAAERAMKHAVFAPHVDNMCSSCGAVDLCPAQSMRDGASA